MSNGVQISTSVTIINSLLGFQAISLSNMSTSAATVITAGSKCEIKSAFFNFPTDLTPNASSWTAIATANTAYLVLTPAGSAGTQTVSASWTQTAPVWSDSAQGWYTSVASVIRHIGGCYKSGTSSYEGKFLLAYEQQVSPLPPVLYQEIVEIGGWNMDDVAADEKVVTHGLEFAKIRGAKLMIINDGGTALYPSPTEYWVAEADYELQVGIFGIATTEITLTRKRSGLFDGTAFNDDSINRGWIIFDMLSLR